MIVPQNYKKINNIIWKLLKIQHYKLIGKNRTKYQQQQQEKKPQYLMSKLKRPKMDSLCSLIKDQNFYFPISFLLLFSILSLNIIMAQIYQHIQQIYLSWLLFLIYLHFDTNFCLVVFNDIKQLLYMYKYKQNMGQAHVHPQYLNSETAGGTKYDNSPITCHSESPYEDNGHNLLIQPISIPCFTVRNSPFKNLAQKEQAFAVLAQAGRAQPIETAKTQIKQYQLKQQQTVKYLLWGCAIYDSVLFFRILDFLPSQDSIKFALASKRLSAQLYFYRLFHRQNNWNYTCYQIQHRILKQGRFSFKKILNQSCFQESEHSLDLERLQSLFLPEQDVSEQLSKVDRIMRALNSSGVIYFQGLNSIVIALANLFQDEICYEIALLLIEKTQSIHNKPQVYESLMQKIDKQVKQRYPIIYQKLEECDLGVEYFAMKWVMDLFSTDIDRNLLIHFWDLLINFGISALKWFVVSIFSVLSYSIPYLSDPDEINAKLKNQLKSIIKGQFSLNILQNTRVLMSYQMFGQGCSDIFRPWNGYTQQINKDQWQSLATAREKTNRSLFATINEQLEQQNQNQPIQKEGQKYKQKMQEEDLKQEQYCNNEQQDAQKQTQIVKCINQQIIDTEQERTNQNATKNKQQPSAEQKITVESKDGQN